MRGSFAARADRPRPLPVTKAHLRGAIWIAALALFVLLPKPAEAAMAGSQPTPVWAVN